jgi:hypothetical protein|tara:strand:- start:1345 stop:1626 length:282 start_codon:yes stop_codon:yes gene_type:complete
MMAEEHICQVYDFTSIREVIMEKKQVETQLQDKLAEMDAKKIEEGNITLDLFTIRDMILNGFDPASAKDIVEYGSKVGYEIDWESETWNPVDD